VQQATAGALPGIEKFDRAITPLTIICSANTYQVRYSEIAKRRLDQALASRAIPPQAALVDKVDIRLRCHSEGFGGMGSRCYADTVLAIVVAGGNASRALETAGRSSEGAVFTCTSAVQAIEQSMEDALARMVDRIGAAN
jgi:hypothetical protein